jgi:hypothetical protein
MRMLLKASLSVERTNAALKDGTLPRTMQEAMGRLKPEAAYFAGLEGKRTALFFFNLERESDLPFVTEPLFMDLGAEIEVVPAMNLEDLQAGLQKAFG